VAWIGRGTKAGSAVGDDGYGHSIAMPSSQPAWDRVL